MPEATSLRLFTASSRIRSFRCPPGDIIGDGSYDAVQRQRHVDLEMRYVERLELLVDPLRFLRRTLRPHICSVGQIRRQPLADRFERRVAMHHMHRCAIAAGKLQNTVNLMGS